MQATTLCTEIQIPKCKQRSGIVSKKTISDWTKNQKLSALEGEREREIANERPAGSTEKTIKA